MSDVVLDEINRINEQINRLAGNNYNGLALIIGGVGPRITELKRQAAQKQQQIQEIAGQFDTSEDKPALAFRAFEIYKELVGIQATLENVLNG